jgi:glutamyl-tRNA synthetase
MRDNLYYAILDALGLRKPRITSFAIVEIANNVTSKREIREMIKDGRISGFDDVRLATIAALRKRGVKPEAIREFALSFGMGKSESVSSIEALLSINRRLIEKNAKRLFFVEKPISLIVKSIPEENKKVSMEANTGGNHEKREYLLNNVFMIDEASAESVKEGAILKLMDLFTVKVTKVINGSIEAEYAQPQEPYTRIVWLNEGNYRSCVLINIGDLLSGDNFNEDSIKRTVGFIEGYVDKLTIGDVVQLEGRGFFKLDESKSRSFISL